METLKCLQGAPSVQMHEVPPDWMVTDANEDAADPDVRTKDSEVEGKKQHEAEFYEHEKDNDNPGGGGGGGDSNSSSSGGGGGAS